MTQTEPEQAIDDGANPAPSVDEHNRVVLENTLLRAGVNLDTDQGKLVEQAWTGRTPDLEAIKRQWELVRPDNAPPPEPDIPNSEPRVEGEGAQALERRELNNNSVVEPNPTDVPARIAAVNAGLNVLAPTDGSTPGTRDDALASAFHVLADAAYNKGDRSVLAEDAVR